MFRGLRHRVPRLSTILQRMLIHNGHTADLLLPVLKTSVSLDHGSLQGHCFMYVYNNII